MPIVTTTIIYCRYSTEELSVATKHDHDIICIYKATREKEIERESETRSFPFSNLHIRGSTSAASVHIYGESRSAADTFVIATYIYTNISRIYKYI